MRLEFNDRSVKFIIGDVRSLDSIDAAMQGVDFVFHAAALKQVPSCEFYPMEAVRTNVARQPRTCSTRRSRNGVRRVVCCRTDKAVYPINAMGMSKAMMEKVAMAKARTSPARRHRRLRHALRQRHGLARLGDPAVRRADPARRAAHGHRARHDALPDVAGRGGRPGLFAFGTRRAGDIFVQKAPAATIDDLAAALLEKLGRPEHPVKVIGTRHGEKLYETLLSREEMARAEDLRRLFPRAAGRPRPQLRRLFQRGRGAGQAATRGLQLAQHAAPDGEGSGKLLLRLPEIRSDLAGWRRRGARAR